MGITERFCSYEVARLLNKKGFDEECHHMYIGVTLEWTNTIYGEDAMSNNEIPDVDTDVITAPTQQMVCDWIFERYGISIEPTWCFFLKGQPWDCSISSPSIGTKWIGNALRKTCKSQEEAIDEAILYVLNNFKQKEQE